MISSAYGMFCCMMKEFTVGMSTSLLPFTTSVGWLIVFQIVEGPLFAPLANRLDLGGRHLVVHFGIAAFLPTMGALQVLPSRRLARRGRTEFDREPDTLGRIVGVGTKQPACSLGYQVHSLTAARTCAMDDQPANEIGRLQSDFLHDQAADREAK